MKHPIRLRRGRASCLGLLGLLTAATALHAQTAPATIYALGTVTADYTVQLPTGASVVYPSGSQTLAALNSANLSPITNFQSLPTVIAGITSGQLLVGIDVRPSTGVLYALGLNATTNTAQLYTITVTTPSTTTAIGSATATPVGAAITLNVSDTNRSNTRGLVPNIGFDFNPRLDRIRVVAPNGANYRLNPNTGQLAASDASLAYTGALPVPAPASAPYVGTVAYTNAQVSARGTTLYDIDVTNTNAVLSTQAPPNDGKLNTVANVTFLLPASSSPGPYPLSSPVIGLGLDIYYNGNPTASQANSAYLVEARYQNNANPVADRYTSNLYTLDLATGRATLLYNIIGGKSIYFADIATPVVPPITWTGTSGTAWNAGANWSTGTVPGAGDNVFIPGNAATQPIVSSAQAVNTVTLGSGAVLTITDGNTLSVNGDFVNNDSRVSGPGTIAFAGSGSSAQDIGGNATTTFTNLSVTGAAGATTSGPVEIQRSLTVSSNLAIGSGQAFTLLSNASGTAYVVNQNSGAVTGVATVQRAISGAGSQALGYHHYSSPVAGSTVADLATTNFSPTVNAAYNTSATPPGVTPFPTVFGYDQSRLSLANSLPEFERGFFSPGATTDALTTGRGYAVNIQATEVVDFQGTLNSGDVTLSNLVRGSQANAGWQLLGNPYPSAIDFDKVNKSGLESALYVIKSTGQYAGGYAAYVNGSSTNSGTTNIPLGQGFFVRVASAQMPGSLSFTNNARTTAPETGLFQRLSNTSPAVALTLSGAGVANQMRVYFEQGATPAFDAAYDAHYLPTTHGLDLASDISTEALAINGLPELSGTVTVPLRVHAATAGTYTLRADELANLPTGYRAYLRDARANTLTDLATTPSLSLALAPADAATGRFSIVVTTNPALATAPAALAALVAVYPNPAHGAATLVLPTTLRGQGASQVEILNTLGQAVLRRTVAAGGSDQVTLPLSGLAAGIYTVRATTAGGSVAKQLRVE